MEYKYWIEGGELCVADDSRLIWRGQPEARRAMAVVRILGTEDAAVLLDPETGPRNALGTLKAWPHLIRVTPFGQVSWRIEAGPHDWWVSIENKANRLIANTWSGLQREIDPTNGRFLTERFTK